MIIGTFGGKSFEVSPSRIFTPRDISISGDLNTSEEDSAGKKPALTVKGSGLIKVSMEFLLMAAAGVNVQSEIDSWMTMKDAAVPYPLILCGRAISLNKFLLTSCGTSDMVISKAAGAPVMASAVLKLEFTEDPPIGASSAAKKTAGAAGLSGSSVPNPYKAPTTMEKAAAKREPERISGQRW